jgi:hypothetical protein
MRAELCRHGDVCRPERSRGAPHGSAWSERRFRPGPQSRVGGPSLPLGTTSHSSGVSAAQRHCRDSFGALALVVALALFAPRALAIPVDRVLDLKVGDLHFEKIRFALAAEVQPKELATAELLPAGELLITPLHEGDGLLLLYKQGEVQAVRLHVNLPLPMQAAPDLQNARRVCTAAEARTVEGELYVYASINDEPCREALKRALEGDAVLADHLRLAFTVPGLQAQLRAMKSRLEAAGISGLTLAYAGATLTLKGSADPATHNQALALLWHEALGHLDLDDQTDIAVPEAPHAP